MFDLFPDEPTYDLFSYENENPSPIIITHFFQTPKVLEEKEEIHPTIPTSEEPVVEENPDIVPSNLKQYITQEVWDSYSSARRESFMNMFKNPNSFFYRNRPPGDPQKMGGFSPEEEEQFIQRINYFRNELKVYDKLWGLFAVPLKGRLGYQCMNFYRHLIEIGRLKKIKPKLDGLKKNKFIVSPEVQSKLEQEALSYIHQCLSLNQQITEPQTKFERPSRNISSQYNEYSDASNFENENPPKTNNTFHNANFKTNKYKIIKKNHKRSYSPEQQTHKHSKNQIPKKSQKSEKKQISFIHYAPDPITGIPMEDPLLDQYSGIVLDRSSWIKYFRNEIIKPYQNICAKKLSDLLPLTPQILSEFRNHISNIFI